MKYEPIVSIVIPVYNGSNYMKIAIDSALAQTYDKVEVVVVNDGSRDNGETDRIARSYGDRIRYFCKENGGVASALNTGIENMSGEWFSWLSHDDVYKPDKIKAEIELLNRQMELDKSLKPEACVVYCGSEQINAQGSVILRRGYRAKERRDFDEILNNLSYMHVGGCTMIIHKKAFQAIGGFDPARTNVQDVDFVYQLYMNRYTFLFVNDYLVQSRRHREQTGNLVKATWQTEIDALNCDFVNRLIEKNMIRDADTMRNMMIYYLRTESRPTAELLKERLKERYSAAEYLIKVRATIALWKCVGVTRKAIRTVYRKAIAGQN